MLVTTALAGCGGNDGDDGGQTVRPATDSGTPTSETPKNGGSTDTPSPSQRTPSEATGTVASTVEELDIVGRETWLDDPFFEVVATVHNAGDEPTDVFDYKYELSLEAEDGTDLTGDTLGQIADGNTDVEPGEEANVTVQREASGTPLDVAVFDLVLTCSDFSEGTYCEE
jgi:hypothetical protein